MNSVKAIALKVLLWAAMIGALALSVYCFCIVFSTDSESQGNLYIVFGTLLLIMSLTLLQFASVGLYNEMNDKVKMVTNRHGLGLDQIFKAFGQLETCLGTPWMGRVQSVRGKVIIFGPNSDGEYVHIQTFGKGRVSVAFNEFPAWLKPREEDAWRLEAAEAPDRLDDIIRHRFGSASILSELAKRLQAFLDTGVADLTPIGIGPKEKIYLFDESFTWNGQDFFLSDIDGNAVLKIAAPIPCKTFHIRNADGAEVFMLTKRVFHILPTYDLFEQGRRIGRMKKRFIFHHDHFVADTARGKLEMRSLNAMFGSNYQVRLNGKQIGTVARKLNVEFTNIVFDNFIISVSAPEYLPLMAAMGVMAAREAQRDKVETAATMADGD